MSLGTSIFISTIVLAFVALYIATKDRWNWKKIILWPLAGLVLIASGLWLYNWIEQRPKIATSLWDIPLGATEGDVKFLKGATKNVTKDKDPKVDEWTYVFEHYSGLLNGYRISFKNGKVWAITYSPDDKLTFGPGIQGINVRDPLEKITEKLGPPSSVSASKDELSRLYSFTKYQVAFELKENRVVGYGIFDSKVAPKGVQREETGEK